MSFSLNVVCVVLVKCCLCRLCRHVSFASLCRLHRHYVVIVSFSLCRHCFITCRLVLSFFRLFVVLSYVNHMSFVSIAKNDVK